MAIKFQDTPVGKAFNAKLKLHSDLRRLNLEAGKLCTGQTLVKMAEAIALLEAEVEELTGDMGGMPIGSFQYMGNSSSAQIEKTANGFPRRNQVDLLTPAETAIHQAMITVEAAGAHPFLTDAVVLLGQAKDKVADYVEQTSDSPI